MKVKLFTGAVYDREVACEKAVNEWLEQQPDENIVSIQMRTFVTNGPIDRGTAVVMVIHK